MAEPSDDSLIREIDEELRQDQAMQFWKAYGNIIIGVALALVLGVAGYQGWRHWDLSQRQEAGDRFVAAQRLADENKTEEALTAFAKLRDDSGAGYALLARLRQAALMAKAGDNAGAVSEYRAIAADSGIAAPYRDLATVLAANIGIDAGEDANAIIGALAPLLVETNAFSYAARELTAAAHLKLGAKAKARDLFDALALDAGAPRGVRNRAREIGQALQTGASSQ